MIPRGSFIHEEKTMSHERHEPESNPERPSAIDLSRRRFLSSVGLAGAGALVLPRPLWAGCDPTSPDMLGPYHVDDAPFRTVLASADEPGTRLFISGRVLANDCVTPIEGAIVDVWHATDAGCYSVLETCPDEDPFNLRGQMLTDANGDYGYETILPGYYTGRPLHVHYIVSPPTGASLTTQLYFTMDPRSVGVPDDLRIPLDTVGSALVGSFDVNLNVTGTVDTDEDHSTPTAFVLHQNYPNPFNPRTTIRYQIRLESTVTLDVFTPSGKLVRRLVGDRQAPGFYTVAWDGTDERGREAVSGTYLYRLVAGSVRQVRKMMLVR
jgi:catechol 1,2-dioxygenase